MTTIMMAHSVAMTILLHRGLPTGQPDDVHAANLAADQQL
jgi:hypothetical protein